jgi:hypothetical protein
VLAVLGLAVMPIALLVVDAREDLRLVHTGFVVPLAAILALSAIVAARRARRKLERTIGRAGGQRAARAGQILGWLGLYLTLIAGISFGVYALEYYVLS